MNEAISSQAVVVDSSSAQSSQNTSIDYEAACSLTALCLPDSVVKCYAAVGITQLFRWQAECLFKTGLLVVFI
jgi:hypothetical protein